MVVVHSVDDFFGDQSEPCDSDLYSYCIVLGYDVIRICYISFPSFF